MKLEDARVLLTGAAGGIGSAVAKRLARSGAKLLLTDSRQDALTRLAADAALRGTAVTAVAANVTTQQDRTALCVHAEAAGINVLINLAGINPFGMLVDQSSADIEKTLSINALAPMLLCHAMLPVLMRTESAHIVNVGSTFGSIGYPGFCAYSASKFAIHGFTEALRRELADTSIRVHYVAPRATRTRLATDRIRALNEELGVGMDFPDTVAHAVEGVLRHEKAETFLGMPERFFARLNGVLPGLVDRALKKQLPVIRRHAALVHAPPPRSDQDSAVSFQA